MENNGETRKLLETYYKGFSEKVNWENVIDDDFEYVGGDMKNKQPVVGKQAYIELLNGFHNVLKL